MDEGRHTPCCQTADAETLESDAEQFNCDTCPARVRMAELDGPNAHAVQLYHRVGTRFLTETQALGPVLVRLAGDRDDEDLSDLMLRCSILYDVYNPPRKESDGGA